MAFGVFELSEEVGVFDGQLLLGGVEVVERSVAFVQFALDFVDLVLELLSDFFGGGLRLQNRNIIITIECHPLKFHNYLL